MLVERRVVMLEGFVVGQVTGSGPIEHRANQAGERTTDTAGGLDVFRRGLRLSGHHHQTQPLYVHAHRDHVRGQQHVQRFLCNVLVVFRFERFFAFLFHLWIEARLKPVENLRDFLRTHTAGQLGKVLAAEESLRQSPPILLAAPGENVVINQTPHPAKFPHRVEVTHEGHPRINLLAVLVVQRLSRAQVSDVHPDQRRFQPATGGTDAEIASPKLLLGRLTLHREEVIPHIESRWREDVDSP